MSNRAENRGGTKLSFGTLRPFIAALFVQINIGSLYAWNIISTSLMNEFGFSGKSMGAVFGTAVLAFTIVMIPVGKRLINFTPRKITFVALLFYCSGFLISGISNGSYIMVLLGNGLLVGLGTGLGYMSSMTYGITPFQDKSTPTGAITASFAIGSVISAKVISHFVTSGVSIGSVLIGIATVQVMLFAIAILLYPQIHVGVSNDEIEEPLENVSRVRAIPLGIGMFSATFGGLLFISNIHQIVHTLNNGVNAAIAVALFSVGNASGRVVMGMIPLTRYRISIIVVMITFALLLFMAGTVGTVSLIYVISLIIGVHFGAFFVLFPMAVIADFGTKLFNKIYPFVFVAYGIAAAVSATVGGTLYDLFNSPKLSLSLAGGIELFGAIVLLISLVVSRKRNAIH